MHAEPPSRAAFVTRGAMLAPLVAASILAGISGTASAQTAGCVLRRAESGPERHVLQCRGVRIEAERGAEYRLMDQNRDGRPEAVTQGSRALLIEADPAQGGDRFQVLTPHAVAAVRGTTWAVDVEGGRSSVFVVQGRVAVARRNGRGAVTLRAGEGVDVAPGAAPLEVRRWPAPRAAALLARFGR